MKYSSAARIVLIFAASLSPSTAQEKPDPIKRENLLKALSEHTLRDEDYIREFRASKVDFEMTARDAEEFRRAGLGEAAIDELWRNDRFIVPTGPPLSKPEIITLLQSGTASPRLERWVEVRKVRIDLDKTTRDEITANKGTPALLGVILTNLVEEIDITSKEGIIRALRSGKTSADIEEAVRVKKAKLFLDDGARKEVIAAGGSSTLLDLLKEDLDSSTKEGVIRGLRSGRNSAEIEDVVKTRKVRLPLDEAGANEIAAAGGSPSLIQALRQVNPIKTYAELLADAEKARKSGDARSATELAEDAKKLDRNKPDAYVLLGSIWLYDRHHIPTARSEYSDAVDRGGTVEFRAKHVDGINHMTRRHRTCSGRLWISKGKVEYKSEAGGHSFTFDKKQITKVERGGVGPLGGGVHIAVGRGKGSTEIFFADEGQNQKEEELLMVDLIKR
jgi:hypothetical protein